MNITFRFILFSLFFVFAPHLLNAQVVINEYSASNLNQFYDNYGKDEDWFELYNTGSSPVNLAGYYLSDDTADITKWQIPAGAVIAANGFFRFWASSRNEVSAGNYHTNFGLNQTKTKKEFVVFTNPSGVLVDTIQLKTTTQTGHSVGRYPDGGSTRAVFTVPTINASNNTSTPYTRYAEKPVASIDAGFYPSAITVSLTTTEPTSSIRYTLDGSDPSVSSSLYTSPLTISTTTVMKAVTFSTNPAILKSFITYNTYFINVHHSVPVVSISGYQLDILANGNDGLIPVGSFEYFDTSGVRKAKTYGDFNAHGQDSWANSQRSIDFVAHDQMGYNKYIKQRLFATTARKEFQNVILRAAGDDNYPADHHAANAGSAHVRDAYIHGLSDQGHLHLDVRRYAKCVVYLNGQYWGVYDLRENPDKDDYCEYYYGQDKYHLYYLMYWGGRWAQYGGTAAENDWDNLHNFIVTQDMSVPANYQYVCDRLDVTSLVDYELVNMFTVCSDWLNWNVGWWRGTDSTGGHQKWGLILWDNDATFGHYINYTGIPNTDPDALPCDPEGLSSWSDPEGMIAALLALRQNPEFNQYYLSRMIDLWNSVFKCDNMLQELDSVVAIIDPEMTQHALKWNGTYTEWQSNVQQLRNYIIDRCAALESGFVDCYSLTGPYNLVLKADPSTAGPIKLNSLIIDQYPWAATYYGGIQTRVKVLPNTGYTFVNWTSGSQVFSPNSTSDSVSFDLSASDTIVAEYIGASVNEKNHDGISMSVAPTIFNEGFTIRYYLPENKTITARLLSTQGIEVLTIVPPSTLKQKGQYKQYVDMKGSVLTSGVYFLDFLEGEHHIVKRLVFIQ